MSNRPTRTTQATADPFDGHLERTVKDMTPAERLDWAWEMMNRLHWARTARRVEDASGPDRPAHHDAQATNR